MTIVGTSFITTPGDNTVMLGDYPCTVTNAQLLQLICDYEDLPAGRYDVGLDVSGVGKATVQNVAFQYEPTLTGISPNSGDTF